MGELESLSGIKEQLHNEKTHADQLQEVCHGVREERDQLRGELELKKKEVKRQLLYKEFSFFCAVKSKNEQLCFR